MQLFNRVSFVMMLMKYVCLCMCIAAGCSVLIVYLNIETEYCAVVTLPYLGRFIFDF